MSSAMEGADDRDRQRSLGGRVNRFVAEATSRFGWGLADQTLSSLTNFALTFVVARSLGATEFGQFAIALTIYLTCLGLSRAAITSPLSIRFSTRPKPEWQEATRSATGSVLVLATFMGLVCLVAAPLVTGQLRGALVALGISLPALLLQDSWRFAFFASGQQFQAFINDLVWAVALLILFIAVSLSPLDEVGWFVAAWGGACAIAGAFGAYQARLIPKPRAALRWWRSHRDLSDWFVHEFIAIRGSVQIATFAIAAVLGAQAVGALRGGAVLFGASNILVMGLGLVAVPEGVRLLTTSVSAFRRSMLALSGIVGALALVWGGVLLVLPDSVGAQLLGQTWPAASKLLLPIALSTALGSAALGFTTGLRSLGAAKTIFRARLFVTAFLLAGVFAGAFIGRSALGVAWGDAIANALSLLVWWWFFHAAMREHGVHQKSTAREKLPVRSGGNTDA
jgi:O-antigen/teichoic acid export membrane protein